MFSVRQKREISDKVQAILRETAHPELPKGEIQFKLNVAGAEDWSYAEIRNNGQVIEPSVNPHNEIMDNKTNKYTKSENHPSKIETRNVKFNSTEDEPINKATKKLLDVWNKEEQEENRYRISHEEYKEAVKSCCKAIGSPKLELVNIKLLHHLQLGKHEDSNIFQHVNDGDYFVNTWNLDGHNHDVYDNKYFRIPLSIFDKIKGTHES